MQANLENSAVATESEKIRVHSNPKKGKVKECSNYHTIWLISQGSKVKWKSLSLVWLFATPWTIQPMEISRPEYWSGWPFPSLEDPPNQVMLKCFQARFQQYLNREVPNVWVRFRKDPETRKQIATGNNDTFYFIGLPNHCRLKLKPWN